MSLLLALALPEAIRDFLIDPALRVFRFLDALPQALVWLGAVGLFALLAWRKFLRPWEPRRAGLSKEQGRGSRAEELQALLRRARYSPWARRHLRTRLARVAVALRGEREKIPPDKTWADLHQDRWPPDPLVRAFLRGEDTKNFFEALPQVIEALERYAMGGEW